MSGGTKIGIDDMIESGKGVLIPGLPDDIALCCLARVPRRCHPILNCVSSKWRELVCSEEFYSYRRKHHLEETWVYALCRDKSEELNMYVLDPDRLKGGWKLIGSVPDHCLKRKGVGFEVLGKKLYLFGGCGWMVETTDEVYCYDASENKWSGSSSLSTARCFFGHEALDGKIYAIGGIGLRPSDKHSWDIYDSHTNQWSFHADPNVILDCAHSVVLDRKIYILGGISPVSSQVHALAYDPSNGTWQYADSDLASGWHGPAIVIDGTLYVLDHSSGLKLMMWKKDVREWMAVRRLSTLATEPPCQLVAIGKKIMVIGKQLGAVMFDVRSAGSMEGFLVLSSAPKFPVDCVVVSCRALTI